MRFSGPWSLKCCQDACAQQFEGNKILIQFHKWRQLRGSERGNRELVSESKVELSLNPRPAAHSMTLGHLFFPRWYLQWGEQSVNSGVNSWYLQWGEQSAPNSCSLKPQNVLAESEWGRGPHRGGGTICHEGLLGPPICPLTSGHQRLLQSSEGTPTLFWKLLEMVSQKESGGGKPLLLAPFGTPFLLSCAPSSLERITSL